MSSNKRLARLILCLSLLGPATARADDIFSGSIGLRGGYDSNPTQVAAGRHGALTSGLDAAFAAAASLGDISYGVTGEGAVTGYADPAVATASSGKLTLTLANRDQSRIALKSTTGIGTNRDYDTRAFDATESLRAQWMDGPIRPFITIEGGRSSLNETNAVYEDFLPKGQLALRGTIIPGVAVEWGHFEAGASVNLSAYRYDQHYDDFGYHRDNERIEPYLFAGYTDDKLNVFVTASRLIGHWHDNLFEDVKRNLFEATVSYDGQPIGFDLSASRTVEETTFPIAPIALDTRFAATMKWHATPGATLSAYGRYAATDYIGAVGIPALQSKTLTLGLGLQQELPQKRVLRADLAWVAATPLAGRAAREIYGVVSFTQRFGGSEGQAEGTKPSTR